MTAEHQNGMQCNEFDALLSDALDHTLSGAKLESFRAHAGSCAICGPLFAEAQEGQRWLKQMAEVEPPVGLVQNILAATSGFDTARVHGSALIPSQVGLLDRLRDWASLFFSPVF